ncbi:calcineurin-binding protein cabin-1-like [Haematobia irritans]|uniref:calcineurin-binding protein cabin-1-like n=1 Tax=Haematobia irritans TaxID=7368 RepID=UPI003F4F4DDD
MIKITALNEDEQCEVSEQEEVTIIKEAQEALAENDYVRAIKFKAEGNEELALALLNDLLETRVLCEGNNDDKLKFIKYNCYKNIAIILEGRCEYSLALRNYISAILIDNSDVYTLHKFGQRALKMNCIELAEYAFENCLRNNSAHWRAAEGKLTTMYNARNLLGSYMLALEVSKRNPKDTKALEKMRDILTWFRLIPKAFILCGQDFNAPNATQGKQPRNLQILSDLMQSNIKSEEDISHVQHDLSNVVITDLSWYSVGQFILDYYAYLIDHGIDICRCFNFKDVINIPTSIDISETTKKDNENSQSNDADEEMANAHINTAQADSNKNIYSEISDIQPMDSNNEDSDTNNKAEGSDISRNKSRRRCSDLHFLEQWGWHKNRRYSSRKKNDKDETDDSLNFYLRRTFSKYTCKSVNETWPFKSASATNYESPDVADYKCATCNKLNLEESFQIATQQDFEKFTKKMNEKPVDIIAIIFKWLKHISLQWNVTFPDEIKLQYIEVFGLYISHYDLASWNQLSSENFESSYRICMLFLELTFNREMYRNDIWEKVYHHLCFNLGTCKIISQNGSCDFELRLLYLKYLLFAEKMQFNECLMCLNQISLILSQKNESFVLHLPNSGRVCINNDYIDILQRQYRSQIDVCNIPKLYNAELWSQLVDIIISNIESSNDKYENDHWLKDLVTMLETLLQSLWKMSSYELCLVWAEKCYHYGVSHYLEEGKSTTRQKMLADFINFTTSYIEAIILNEGHQIVALLNGDDLSRMVQNIIRILIYQFEGNFDKNSTHGSELNFKRPWVILHQILLRDEENSNNPVSQIAENNEETNESMPCSFLLLFTAHEYLGKRQWCSVNSGEFLQYVLDAVVVNFKAPIYDMCRDVIYEYIEQVTYCLYNYPPKKARSKHLEEHEAYPIKLTWERALQLFDLYKPEQLPEFNSYKAESITSDMEQMLIKMISLVPKEFDPSPYTENVINYIEGLSSIPPAEIQECMLPYKIISLYYLLADFYFKNRDFSKATKFYTLDLVINPTRFDSWAGIALSKASQIETKLNGLDQLSMDLLWIDCDQVLRCFERCTALNKFQTLLWIEYGSFCYTIHSHFSRCMKYCTKTDFETMPDVDKRKDNLLNIAQNCFSFTSSLQNSSLAVMEDCNDTNDEKWLCQYMLGKIAEKRKQEPKLYLTHYLSAANYLYESSASYPIKINHNNPTPLSVEALEVFYRINAAIIKYITREGSISRSNGDLFNKILKNLTNSPFAFNKAKIDGNSLTMLRKKMGDKIQIVSGGIPTKIDSNTDKPPDENEKPVENVVSNAPSRRISQESSRSISRSSSTSTILSTESSSTLSESDTDMCLDEGAKNNTTYSFDEMKAIYKMVIKNIEECVTRFPEHYKSLYRLVHHYMNSPPGLKNMEACEQLLMGQYKTSLGNVVNGLFYERKTNNLFNGIWRIPSSEIDRPGSFSAHLVKCVKIFIALLFETKNHKILIDIALNLCKTPDADKRYIADAARKDLYQQCISNTVQILRESLEKNKQERNDLALVNLLLDIYKIHKKCVKYMSQKEPTFTKLLTEAYKVFISDKVQHLPENSNYLDLAIKLCLQELTSRKALEKSNKGDDPKGSTESTTNPLRYTNIPGLGININKQRNFGPITARDKLDMPPAFNYPDVFLPPFLSTIMSSCDKNPASNDLRGYSLNTADQEAVANNSIQLQSLQRANMQLSIDQVFNASLMANSIDTPLQSKIKASMKNRKMDFKPYSRPNSSDTQLQPSECNYEKYESLLKANEARLQCFASFAYENYNQTDREMIQKAMYDNALADRNLGTLARNDGNKEDGRVAFSPSDVPKSIVPPNMLPIDAERNPVKTLQQKLAERQKVSQLHELNSSSSTSNIANNNPPEASNTDDVIILD